MVGWHSKHFGEKRTRSRGGKGESLPLPLFHLHSLPADKPVDVICQKHCKAYDDRDVPFVAKTRKRPLDDKYDIVGGISQTEIRTAKRQVNGKKTCGDRNRAWDYVCRVKITQYIVKSGGDQKRGKEHHSRFMQKDTMISTMEEHHRIHSPMEK